ncbi:MAG: hypothetical protein TREMPRED_000864 [Tremellales sp. Tagirdzhanova-0007]|nr:MAG: hypothetical protein TREMPRED_000864 [Tremellales sp. Tagirdzhanova-0007]
MAGVNYEQFKGKPFQVISKLGVRYTGIFDHISQEDQTICLSQVFNHGTEERPTPRKLPGSTTTLGWVRFHTESIESLALVENYVAPGEEAPIDPILASVSPTAPVTAKSPPAQHSPTPVSPAKTSQPRFDLPRKPSNAAQSAATALDRVQKSLSNLSVDGPQPSRRKQSSANRPPEVPDAEFDFSKGTEQFEAEREARAGSRLNGKDKNEDGKSETSSDTGTPIEAARLRQTLPNGDGSGVGTGLERKSSAYIKNGFFDGLSGESSRVSRADERHRNLDTFGEAGGDGFEGGGGRGSGGYGGRGYGGRGYGGRGHGGRGHGGRGGYSVETMGSQVGSAGVKKMVEERMAMAVGAGTTDGLGDSVTGLAQ